MSDRLSSTARMQFLGAQRIEIGNEVLTPESERLFAMLVRLSVPLGRMTSRQTMMDTLWPGSDDVNARHNLRQTVYKAREIGLVIESGEDGLRLDPRYWTCDWDEPVGDVSGEWLAGYDPAFSEELMAWVTAQRLSVHALIRPRIVRSLQTARSAGDMHAANRYAVQLLGIDELNEEATLTCAEQMALQGAKVDALKLLDGYLAEIGRVGAGRDAGLPAQLLRRRIAEKLPTVTYQSTGRHHGPLVGRACESQTLTAGLFDARAGRGAAYLVHGPEGSGKSRLLHELRTSAVLQGMRVVEHQCTLEPTAAPFATLRALVDRLSRLPGAIGVSPEALEQLRRWLLSDGTSPDDCPLAEIEDLLAAVSEETPLLLQVEHTERMDQESLTRLDRLYRKGVSRYHALVLTSASQRLPADGTLALPAMTRVPLRPMSTADVRLIVTAYAEAEKPFATSKQIACAAVFAEGIPMYGIEMLGLMLDEGSPDIIPWRVQMAVDRALRELDEVQWRVLALAGVMDTGVPDDVVEASLDLPKEDIKQIMSELESWGFITFTDGSLCASGLMSTAADALLTSHVIRRDAVAAASMLRARCIDSFEARTLYTTLRLYARAGQPTLATQALDRFAGALLRADSAHSVIFELQRLKEQTKAAPLISCVNAVISRVRSGAESRRSSKSEADSAHGPQSLPRYSKSGTELEHTLARTDAYNESILIARDPEVSPSIRLTEAVTALTIASNHEDIAKLDEAFVAAGAVRHALEINPFDLARCDTIYYASKGLRANALLAAERLADASRSVTDVQLACRGLRNAAEACTYFGDFQLAQAYLLESRAIASRLDYHAQLAYTDIRLADLRLEENDAIGARAYLRCAEENIVKNRVHAPLIEADLHLHYTWEALASNDFTRAQKSGRIVLRRLAPAEKSGVPVWTALSTKLATRRGALTKDVVKDITRLKNGVGRFPYAPNESFSLAALLLTTQGTPMHSEMCTFVEAQFPRILATRQTLWPMIVRSLEDRPRQDG